MLRRDARRNTPEDIVSRGQPVEGIVSMGLLNVIKGDDRRDLGKNLLDIRRHRSRIVHWCARTASGRIPSCSKKVSYARVVTDLSTFAWLCDVYVIYEPLPLAFRRQTSHTYDYD